HPQRLGRRRAWSVVGGQAVVGNHLATQAEFGEQKIVAIEGQLPGHVDQLVIQTQEQVGGGDAGEALAGRGGKEVGKDQLAQALQRRVEIVWRFCASADTGRVEERALVGQRRDPPQLFADLGEQALLDLDLAAGHDWVDLTEVDGDRISLAQNRQVERCRCHRASLPSRTPYCAGAAPSAAPSTSCVSTRACGTRTVSSPGARRGNSTMPWADVMLEASRRAPTESDTRCRTTGWPCFLSWTFIKTVPASSWSTLSRRSRS